MRAKTTFLACLVAVSWVLSGAAVRAAADEPAGVRLIEEEMVIPTYRVGEPEKNPIFFAGRSYQGAKGPIYPYPIIDKLSDVKEDKRYKAIVLENRWVKYIILPEIGGRIFAALDKTNGYDFVYRQHVIKPALIGMVGAWISGGVEWNIPHHHRASTFMPVDYRLARNADGSRTVWLGETELRHRMRWIVGLTLRPDRSWLQVTMKLFNRTPLPNSLLYFANIAVHANADYQVIFPPSTEFGTQHGKSEFVSWPIGSGRYGGQDRSGVDVSWWKNLPTPASIFAWNYEEDFFGGYDHGKKAGIAVVADHNNAPGKKFFEWGNGNEGRMWETILSDSDGPYLELMAGAYSDNQPDYSWIQPGEAKVVEQYFYPLRELGGMKAADLDAALNLEATDPASPPVRARLAINATAELRDARVILKAGDKVLSDGKIDIGPGSPWVKEVALPEGARGEDLQASLVSSSGKEIIRYRPAPPKKSPMPKAVEPPPAPKDIATADELYLAGLRLQQFHSPALEPEPYFEEALKRDPGDYRANVAMGILYLKRGMFAEAEEKLAAAVERATRNWTRPKDGEALYYLGVARMSLGKGAEAEDALGRAAWSAAWSAASNLLLAESACGRGDLAAAAALLDRSIAANALDPRAFDMKAAVMRKLNRREDAEEALARAGALDPLDFWCRNERCLLRAAAGRKQDSAKAVEDLVTDMRGETSSYLELAVNYASCRFAAEAIEVLERIAGASADKGKVSPLVHYYLAYLWEMESAPDKAAACAAAAKSALPDWCFPFQIQSMYVLRRAMERDPSDARAPYYLGNLLFDLQPRAAVEAWEKSRDLDGSFATVHRNLGNAYARLDRDTAKAIASYEKAVACDHGDPKVYAELDALYETANASPEKRLALLETNHDAVARRDDALLREISLEILLGKYDRAIDLMSNRHFHAWEGEIGVHDVYADALLLRGRKLLAEGKSAEARTDFEAALEYPDRFETAKPSAGGGKTSEVHYWLGAAWEAAGDADRARAEFQEAAKGRNDASEPRYYQGLAHRKLGEEEKATAIFDGLIKTGQERLQAVADLDFFAKFGTKGSPAMQKARAHYLAGLGRLGKGEKDEAKKEFEATLELNAAHLGARTMLPVK